MTDRLTHPASEVPGGLWDGAPVSDGHREGIAMGTWGTMLRENSAYGTLYVADIGEGWDLRLDDPLGLGLAGLAASVAQRLKGYDLNALDPWWDGIDARQDSRTLERLASYLALTDRLCAAVGLELEPGEVARWAHHEGEWALATTYRPVSRAYGADTVPALADIDPSDWLGALRACVAVALEVLHG